MTLDPGAGARSAPAIPDKNFHRIGSFEPELGGYLEEVTLAYETWGELDPSGENAILIVHALTGDSHCAGGISEAYKRGGWWDEMVGPGRLVDTDEHFVVCSNVLGGCSGSTGPASVDPATDIQYGMRFPIVTISDIVRAQKRLLDDLGVRKLEVVIGGALGPQGLGMSEIGRRAIMADPNWQGGDYYGTGKSPETGLAIARMAGMLTYQSAEGQWERFGREEATRPALYEEFGGRFEIESYLHYQGHDLTGRFDANSYLYLTRAMDLYDIGAGYASHEEAYERIEAEVLFVGISSDWLFPAREVRAAAELAKAAGAEAHYEEIESLNGHDAFLKDWDELRAAVGPFLD
jgi:homoserine O-acetyltransferase